MDSDSHTLDQDEGREEDRSVILRRIEEKLDRLLGSGDDDWHEREWAPPDSPFAPYGPGGPRPSFIAPADASGWDPSLAGPRSDDPVPSFDDAQPLAARSSAREYYLLMRARQQQQAAAGYADYRRRKKAELDFEYADYCRDRQACFDRDFDAWRQKRAEPAPSVDEPARQESAGKQKAQGL
jgi:hypothetical protein